jgi:hypothetical protein
MEQRKAFVLVILTLSVALNIYQILNRPQPPVYDDTEAKMYREMYNTQRGLADVLYQQSLDKANKRDTIYQERVVLKTKWNDRISAAPTDSVVHYRLDSCIELGGNVLQELEVAKEELVIVRAAYDTLRISTISADSAFAIHDSEVFALQDENGKLKRSLKGQRIVNAALAIVTLAVLIAK